MPASSDYRLILADEPDAFLHPQLARRLGAVMADLAAYEEINHRLTAAGRMAVDDAVFLNAQNKGTVRRLVRPPRELGVPVAAVVDLDILETAAEFKRLLDGCFVPDVTAAGPAATRGHLLATFGDAKPDLKRHGLDRFTGANREAAAKLLADLREYGIFTVPLGELEGWLAHLGVEGPKDVWLPRLFERLGSDPADAGYVHPGDGDVWRFVGDTAAWAANPRRKGMPAG